LTGLLAYAPAAICAGLMLLMMFGMRHGDAPGAPAVKTPIAKDPP
jgi:hypothetical protein